MRSIYTAYPYLLGMLIFLSGWQRSSAQEGQPKIEAYNFSVIYLSYPLPNQPFKERPLNLIFFSDQKAINISAHEGGMSRFFSHKGASKLPFYRENGRDESGEMQYAPVLQVDMGKSGQKLILVICKPNGSLVGTSFDMSLEAFPVNNMRLFNFSNQAVKAKVAENMATIESFKAKNFELEVEWRKSLIDFALAVLVDGKAEVIEMTRLAFTQNGRRLIFVYNEVRDPEKIRYRVFPIARPVAVENESDEELEVEDYEKYEREERMAQ